MNRHGLRRLAGVILMVALGLVPGATSASWERIPPPPPPPDPSAGNITTAYNGGYNQGYAEGRNAGRVAGDADGFRWAQAEWAAGHPIDPAALNLPYYPVTIPMFGVPGSVYDPDPAARQEFVRGYTDGYRAGYPPDYRQGFAIGIQRATGIAVPPPVQPHPPCPNPPLPPYYPQYPPQYPPAKGYPPPPGVPPVGMPIGSDAALFTNGQQLYSVGRYADSAHDFYAILTSFPTSQYREGAVFWLASAYKMSGNHAISIRAFVQLLKDYPNFGIKPLVYLRAADSNEIIGAPQDAILWYDRQIREFPADERTAEARYRRARLLESTNLGAAIQEYRTVVGTFPASAFAEQARIRLRQLGY